MLAPDRADERTRRHRVLMSIMYKRHGQYLSSLQHLTNLNGEPPDANTDLVHRHIQRRSHELEQLRTKRGEKTKWNDTEAIKEAARATWSRLPNADGLVQEALLEWQAGSGASHGLVWSTLGQSGTAPVTGPDAQGLAVTSAAGSYLRIINAYMLAFRLTERGWALLRRRGL